MRSLPIIFKRIVRAQRILHITREQIDWRLDLDKWLKQEAAYRREDEKADFDPVGSFRSALFAYHLLLPLSPSSPSSRSFFVTHKR